MPIRLVSFIYIPDAPGHVTAFNGCMRPVNSIPEVLKVCTRRSIRQHQIRDIKFSEFPIR